MSAGEERTIQSSIVFNGKMIRLETLVVELPNGKTSIREVVRHPGAVAVVAEPSPGTVLCIRQFRAATGETLLELPAGKLEPDESPDHCAIRELQEETGYVAGQVAKVYEFYTSPGFADERIHLFHAADLTKGEHRPDDDEFLDVVELSCAEAQRLLADGVIRDAKTIIGLLWWLHTQGA